MNPLSISANVSIFAAYIMKVLTYPIDTFVFARRSEPAQLVESLRMILGIFVQARKTLPLAHNNIIEWLFALA